MRIQFNIYKKDDDIEPIINIITAYYKDYYIYDAEVVRRGVKSNYSIYIDLDIQRRVTAKDGVSTDTHTLEDVVALIKKCIEDFDKPNVWSD